jgi:hypothetical protein
MTSDPKKIRTAMRFFLKLVIRKSDENGPGEDEMPHPGPDDANP